jgi:cyanophycin synthetase
LVRLTSVSNVSAGGCTRDVTDLIHAGNGRIACLAAAVVGLDMAGIDLVVPDIARPFWETGGAIVEINSNPGLIDHLQPGSGTPRDVGGAVLDMLYPAGQPVRARIVVVLESDESAAICRSLGQVLADAGWMVGVASQDGLAIGSMALGGSNSGHPHGIRMLLANPAVEIGVVEIGVAAIAEYGLGFDECDAILWSEPGAGIDRPGLRSVEAVLGAALDGGSAVAADAAVMAIKEAVRTLELSDVTSIREFSA